MTDTSHTPPDHLAGGGKVIPPADHIADAGNMVVTDKTEVERLRTEAHKIARTAEMSAGIMRDARRTGGWAGAENTARAFERISERMYQVRNDLAALAASPAPRMVGLRKGEWFYPEGDHSSDECRFSPDEVIDYALEGEWVSKVVAIERAASLPTVYAAVTVHSEAEKDTRGSDDDYSYILCPTADEANALLAGAIGARGSFDQVQP